MTERLERSLSVALVVKVIATNLTTDSVTNVYCYGWSKKNLPFDTCKQLQARHFDICIGIIAENNDGGECVGIKPMVTTGEYPHRYPLKPKCGSHNERYIQKSKVVLTEMLLALVITQVVVIIGKKLRASKDVTIITWKF